MAILAHNARLNPDAPAHAPLSRVSARRAGYLACQGHGRRSCSLIGELYATVKSRRSEDVLLRAQITEEMMNPVVHFEMPYDDRVRMAKFYQSAFSWQTQMLGEDMGNYVIVTTTSTAEDGPRETGAINVASSRRNRIGLGNIRRSLSRSTISTSP
jgi:hypothetical protein